MLAGAELITGGIKISEVVGMLCLFLFPSMEKQEDTRPTVTRMPSRIPCGGCPWQMNLIGLKPKNPL